MKAKKIAAISSAIIFGTSTALAGMPQIVSAQEQTVNIQPTVTEENSASEAEKPDSETSIDAENFPDAVFRSYVEHKYRQRRKLQRYFDTN